MANELTEGQKVKCGGIECTILEIDGSIVTIETPYGNPFITMKSLIKWES